MIRQQHLVLAITASIAAYKAVDLLRELQRQFATVDCILTTDAQHFVTPVLIETLLGKPAYMKFWDEHAQDKFPHITLGKSDILLVAPATAHSVAKFAHGFADDLLSATFLSHRGRKILVPAMNPSMYLSPRTQDNLATLRNDGVLVIEPESGRLACGDEGIGRFPALDVILKTVLETDIQDLTEENQPLKGKKILITAGGTRESLDPVRFIGNWSTGTVGYHLANEASKQGAEVTLVCANCTLPPLPAAVKKIAVVTSSELQQAVFANLQSTDVLIMAAAVADFTPEQFSEQKFKKGDAEKFTISLKRTPDILQEVAKWKKSRTGNKQLKVIGFAAETENLQENGLKKLQEKTLDMIVVNKVPESFGEGGMECQILGEHSLDTAEKKLSKVDFAKRLLAGIRALY
ncbi:MAG: bifunctional phosphopantothenoylcysteine decarboxylase/phosphopantothenate--cysteine ligase CoaBC [bacterium]